MLLNYVTDNIKVSSGNVLYVRSLLKKNIQSIHKISLSTITVYLSSPACNHSDELLLK
jgi:hypothetical protein